MICNIIKKYILKYSCRKDCLKLVINNNLKNYIYKDHINRNLLLDFIINYKFKINSDFLFKFFHKFGTYKYLNNDFNKIEEIISPFYNDIYILIMLNNQNINNKFKIYILDNSRSNYINKKILNN